MREPKPRAQREGAVVERRRRWRATREEMRMVRTVTMMMEELREGSVGVL